MNKASQGNLEKRTSKRFFYFQPATSEFQGMKDSIQLQDISLTGIQFISIRLLRPPIPAKFTWNDQEIGTLDPTMLVLRKTSRFLNGVTRYHYGSKFTNLRQETKQNIENLIEARKAREAEENKKLLEKIGLEKIMEMLDGGRAALRDLLKNPKLTKLYAPLLREMKDYERESFDAADEISGLIQMLSTQSFHCKILALVLWENRINIETRTKIFKITVKKLETMEILKSDAASARGKISFQKIEDQKKQNLSQMVAESSSRLQFSRLELLPIIIEIFGKEKGPLVGLQDAYVKIVQEYDDLNPTIKVPTKYNTIKVPETITSKPADTSNSPKNSSKPENHSATHVSSIKPIQPIIKKIQTQKKSGLQLWMGGLFVALVVSGYVIYEQCALYKTNKWIQKLSLPVQILDAHCDGPQVNITIRSQDWNNLGDINQQAMIQKMYTYIQTDPVKEEFLLLDENQKLLRVIYKQSR